jgi:ribosomal protein S18 acetylase RimI-like enzyme
MTTTAVALSYHTLTGEEFEDAISGQWRSGGQHVIPRWLNSPKLKYYMHRSCLIREPDQRTFFLCTVPADINEGEPALQDVVGMLELQVSPFDDTQVWLKYITVNPAYQRRGIAKHLLALMVSHLKANPRCLSRSRASEEGAVKIQSYIDRLLTEENLAWTQSGRDA